MEEVMIRKQVGTIRFFAIVSLVAGLLLSSAPGWAQKAKPPQPPAPSADPAIAYIAEKSWGSTDLMVMNADGTNQKVLLTGTKKPSISSHDPSWSPDGNRLAFYSDIQGPGVYIINKDGSGLCKVVAMNEGGSYGAGNPQWSPDGAYILFSDTEGPGLNEDLYLTAASCGSGLRMNLTNTPDIAEFWPTWSPDGTRLAACIVGDQSDVIVYDLIVGAGGSLSAVNPVNLTASGPLKGLFSSEIAWAKSTDRIAVCVGSGYARDIWVVYPGAPGVADNLTKTPLVEDRDPSWAPMDAKIVFACAGNVYIMNPDGTDQTRIAGPPAPNKPLQATEWRRNP
jgi:Tol biopolymer transport system component